MKRVFIFLMCLCSSMMFFACGQNNSESTGTGDSSQIEQGTGDTSSDSSDNNSNDNSDEESDDDSSDKSDDESDNSSDSSDGNDGVWTPPAKQ